MKALECPVDHFESDLLISENRRGIGQPKWHSQELEGVKRTSETCLEQNHLPDCNQTLNQ